MSRLNGKDKIAVIVICISLVVGAVVFAVGMSGKDRYASDGEINARIDELTSQKEEYKAQLAKMEEDYELSTKGISTEEILVNELSNRIYTELFPLLKSYDAVAEVALDETVLKGNSGGITIPQIKELLENGWGICYKYDGSEDLEPWLEDMRWLSEKNNLPVSEVVYFTEGQYKSEYDEILQRQNITIAVHHGEEGLPIMVKTSEDGGIWHIGARTWNGADAKIAINNLISDGANCVFEVNFQDGDAHFTEKGFSEMLDYVGTSIKEDKLRITTFIEGRSFRYAAGLDKAEYEEKHGEAMAQIENRIDQINSEIKHLYGN